MISEVSKEQIDAFIEGSDSMEKIVKIECSNNDDKVYIVYYNEKNEKRIKIEPFFPFLWAKQTVARDLFNGDRALIKKKLYEYGIWVKPLRINATDNTIPERMENGYRLLFYAKTSMSFNKFRKFFEEGGLPITGATRKNANYGRNDYITVSANEQYMIQTGRRMFKGFNDYNDLKRFSWDLETEGLVPEKDMISQIGMRTNKGFEKIIPITGDTEEKKNNEEKAIYDFFECIKNEKPDVITGYNTEKFDVNFIDVALKQRHNTSLSEATKPYFPKGMYKSPHEQVLKLGGEMEHFYPTIMWGTNITDGLNSVRRAQALNSNIKKADLKYITRFSKLNKPNRVYVPGKIINTTWLIDKPIFAFDDNNGKWFEYNSKAKERTFKNEKGEVTQKYTLSKDKKNLHDNEENEDFTMVTGRYIVERYLLDDLYETDKVEHKYNITNFFMDKMVPVSFEKMCTMGTAAIWRYIMLAWSYEHDLAVPSLIERKKFVGGLSRLLKVGYVDRIVKLDYNSLYPSIILSYDINSEIDIMGAMSTLLEYILTSREHYKGLKKKYGKKIKEIQKKIENHEIEGNIEEIKNELEQAIKFEALYDNMQLAIKVIGNGFFGSYGSGKVFPWSDMECAEETTCTGRQCLRLMIKHFTDLGYNPIVGDSVTSDTPLFVKYDNGDINIKYISEIFDKAKAEDFGNGQMRDFSHKPYKVLTRNGWTDIRYVYRHKTNKSIRSISNVNGYVDCTIDHSLFDINKNEIKPSDIIEGIKLETYDKNILKNDINESATEEELAKAFVLGMCLYGSYVTYDGYVRFKTDDRKNIDILQKKLNLLNINTEIEKDEDLYILYNDNEFSNLLKNNLFSCIDEKQIPDIILNSNMYVRNSFIRGRMLTIKYPISYYDKTLGNKKLDAGINCIMRELQRCDDFPDAIDNRELNNKVISNLECEYTDGYVYDISADGTFIDAYSMFCCHNTDGFNFQIAENLRYTDEHPYISNGNGRNSVKGQSYVGVEADVCEFEDIYLCEPYIHGLNKMGLGIDEYCDVCIQFARKNYADLMPDGSIKLVGNTIKSKKMPLYIEKFLNKGIEMLLHNQGKEFLESYYDYIEKIYNMQIPINEIASVGKIKIPIETYVENCKQLTKGGTKKARQAWYELVIKDDVNVNIGDAIYYINTDSKAKSSDVQRITNFYTLNEKGEKCEYILDENGEPKTDRKGNPITITKELKRLYAKYRKDNKDNKEELLKYNNVKEFGLTIFPSLQEEDVIIYHCVRIPNEIIEDETVHYCEGDFEYNREKYIEMFNNRIKSLLVCFNENIRNTVNEKGQTVNNILITNPKDRKCFTEEESKLVSGQPYFPTDQDTYEQLMTMDDREVKFWVENNKIPHYYKECGMDWEQIKKDYLENQEKLKEEGIAKEIEEYNNIIDKLSKSDIDSLIEEGILPTSLMNLVDDNLENNSFISKKYGVKLGSIFDIIDKDFDNGYEEL